VLDIDLLGAHSQTALRFAIEASDIVGLSFVSRARREADERISRPAWPAGPACGVEDRDAVMNARGDLAVECGYERLAEVQEEILWLCQAAHVPFI